MSADRFFPNPFGDYREGETVRVDESLVSTLVREYVEAILEGTKERGRGDLYVGDAGIAFMFLRLSESTLRDQFPALEQAKIYSKAAKRTVSDRAEKKCALLSGNAGILAVSAAINSKTGESFNEDIKKYKKAIDICRNPDYLPDGCDDFYLGRAGYFAGMCWLNSRFNPKPFSRQRLEQVAEASIIAGRSYARRSRCSTPLMWQYHGKEYLGAAHGVVAILLALLESPSLEGDAQKEIQATLDAFLATQNADGDFPSKLGGDNFLVHWCHGAPGAVYVLAKAWLVFKEEKYLEACKRSADSVWRKGLLKKGPGICHGVAGNGYVFLLLFRLTGEQKYLYRATKFAEFLKSDTFRRHARTPDRPFSLFEGLAGTVCYLLDLLEPDKAAFPFMDVFGKKYD